MAETLKLSDEIGQIVERYRYMNECVVLGRGYNYATAFELALKLKELTYTIAEPYSSADFMHGPLALIEHGFPAIVVAPIRRGAARDAGVYPDAASSARPRSSPSATTSPR